MSLTEQDVRRIVRDELYRVVDAGLSVTAEQQPTRSVHVPDLPKELVDMLEFGEGYVKPKGYIQDKNLWNEINTELRKAGYQWTPAGADSAWRR